MRREEQLSLKLHQHILSKIQMQPTLIDQAHSNLMRYHQQGRIHPFYFEKWQEWFLLDFNEQKEMLLSTDDDWITLRQSSPFAGILNAKERNQILKDFRQEWHKR